MTCTFLFREKYLKEEAVRFKKYEADMRQELIETYFSDKDIFGGNIIKKKLLKGLNPFHINY